MDDNMMKVWEQRLASESARRQRLNVLLSGGLAPPPVVRPSTDHETYHAMAGLLNEEAMHRQICALRDELEAMVHAKYQQHQKDVREVVEQEWHSKLEELDFAVKQRHCELRQLFERNTKTALQIGEKVLESDRKLDNVEKEVHEAMTLRKEVEAQGRTLNSAIEEVRRENVTLRKLLDEVNADKEAMLLRISDVKHLQDDLRKSELRLERRHEDMQYDYERRCDDKLRTVTLSIEQTQRDVKSCMQSQSLLTERVAVADEFVKKSTKEIARLKSRMANQNDAIDAQADAIEDMKEKITALTEKTVPGSCQGCRLIQQDLDNKLFTVKQSVCFLDKTIKSMHQSSLNATGQEHSGAQPVTPSQLAAVQDQIAKLADQVRSLDHDVTELRSAPPPELPTESHPQPPQADTIDPADFHALQEEVAMMRHYINDRLRDEDEKYMGIIGVLEDRLKDFNRRLLDVE